MDALTITPFLLFDGNCAEAMSFYKVCFGGELTLLRVEDTERKDQLPKDQHHKIIYARLISNAIDFSATDWLHPTRKPKQGNTVAMYVSNATPNELKEVFFKLAEDADKELLDEPQETPFGIYGHLADKYGVHWFFMGNKDR